MKPDEFAQEVGAARWRVVGLMQRAGEVPRLATKVLPEAFEELNTTLEELRVADEELREQTEELIATREEIDAERERYRELFDSAPDGYLVTYAEGTIQEANHAAARLLNVQQEKLVGKPLPVFIPTSERRAFRAHLLQLQNADRVQEWEITLQPRKGEATLVAVRVTAARDRRGRPVALRWTFRDITDRTRAEAQIDKLNSELEGRIAERTAELEAANQQKDELLRREQAARADAFAALQMRDQFISVASHEVKTPLNVISGYAELLKRQVEQSLGPDGIRNGDGTVTLERERVLRALKNMEHAAATLTHLINELMDVTQIESGKLSVSSEPVNLADLLLSVTDSLRLPSEPGRRAREVQLEVTLPPERQVWGLWDRNRLEQVLANLVGNAIKYSHAGGTVRVTLSVESVPDLDPARQCAHLVVQDQGIGIPPGEQQRIFQPFMRATNAGSKFPGIGLGLAISREIVERHGGRIWVQSGGTNQGSTFHVLLPGVKTGTFGDAAAEENLPGGTAHSNAKHRPHDSFNQQRVAPE